VDELKSEQDYNPTIRCETLAKLKDKCKASLTLEAPMEEAGQSIIAADVNLKPSVLDRLKSYSNLKDDLEKKFASLMKEATTRRKTELHGVSLKSPSEVQIDKIEVVDAILTATKSVASYSGCEAQVQVETLSSEEIESLTIPSVTVSEGEDESDGTPILTRNDIYIEELGKAIAQSTQSMDSLRSEIGREDITLSSYECLVSPCSITSIFCLSYLLLLR